jgi:hypothetical protein
MSSFLLKKSKQSKQCLFNIQIGDKKRTLPCKCNQGFGKFGEISVFSNFFIFLFCGSYVPKKKKKKKEVINDKSFHIHVPRGSTSIIGLSNVSLVKNHLYITDY